MTFSALRGWPRQVAGVGVALVVITCLAVGRLGLRDQSLRYELTIEIETPEGPRRGSSVIEVTIERSMPFWGDNGIHYRIKGKAPAVELPDGRLVFALLHDATNIALPGLAAKDARAVPDSQDRTRRHTAAAWSQLKAEKPVIFVDAATMSRRTATGPGVFYPDIVALDPTDPTSIRAIDPADAENVLGPGFSVKGLELRIVDSSPDTAFDPPWLSSISQASDRVASSTGPLRHSLNPARFVAHGRD